MIIKFGKKHKGKKVEDCPSDYLQWLVDKLDPEDPNWGEQNKKLIEASKNVLTARAIAHDKGPKSPVAASLLNANVIMASDLPTPPVNALIGIKEDLEIAAQAIQRIAFGLARIEGARNNQQPF